MAVPTLTPPSLSRDALAGRLQRATEALGTRDDAHARWQRGWLLSAAGRYGQALAELTAAGDGDPAVRVAALMTRAGVLRQVGLHDLAQQEDEAGLALLAEHRISCPTLRAGLLVGLVADAVGQDGDAASLQRRRAVAMAAVSASGSWRQRVRLGWVSGEVALHLRAPAQAATAFAQAARQAAQRRARRHEAKSLIFLAAARAAAGEHRAARRVVRRGLHLAARCGAAPLLWPAELILAETEGGDAAATHLARARSVLVGLLATLPAELSAAARLRPPADWLLTTG